MVVVSGPPVISAEIGWVVTLFIVVDKEEISLGGGEWNDMWLFEP